MTTQKYPSSSDLAHFVDHIWIARWDAASGASYPMEVVESPCVQMVVSSEIAEIFGMMTKKSVRSIAGNGTVIGITFKPGGFYPFFRKPLDRLTNQTKPLTTMLSVTRIKKLTSELDKTDHALVTATEKLLRSKRPEADPNIEAIAEIITRIQKDPQLTSVQAVCDFYDMSERTLQRTFQQYVGIGLKWIIAQARLHDSN